MNKIFLTIKRKYLILALLGIITFVAVFPSFQATSFSRFDALVNAKKIEKKSAVADRTSLENPLLIQGEGFTVKRLYDGGQAFSNRKYIWENVPTQFQGWQYTQTAGGQVAEIEVDGQVGSTIYIATVPGRVTLTDWEQVLGVFLRYNDKNNTSLQVYRKIVDEKKKIVIPQGNWTGTLVLSPTLNITNQVSDKKPVPGVVINYSPAYTRKYIGSPSIAVLPNGEYIASHDFFGAGTTSDETEIFRSYDRGKTWQHITKLQGQWWSTLFLHQGILYIIGTDRSFGNIVIRKSLDGGKTWTVPENSNNGLLSKDVGYHSAPVPIIVHGGRIWRAMEQQISNQRERKFTAFVMSAPINANLLQAKNWKFTNRIKYEDNWIGTNWLEGNVVTTRQGKMANILRVSYPGGEKAAIMHISNDGRKASFNPVKDLIDFPGGGVKFTIRYDRQSKLYWSLVNKQAKPDAERNILALISSPDLRTWTIKAIVLKHSDREYHGFQYADWLFDGKDIIFVSRTAFNNAHNYHDANYLTFHRIKNFRER